MPQNKISTYPVQWHEGMLLMPQHFQQSDLRNDYLLSYHLKHLSPFYWGIINCRIDEAALPSGLFRLLSLEAVMPDGFVVNETTGRVFEIDLKPRAAQIQNKTLTIYICLPLENGNAADIIGSAPRYISFEGRQEVDMNTGEQKTMIPRLAPNISLVASYKYPPANMVSIPLAIVQYDTKTFSLIDYIPPALKASYMSALIKMCEDIAQKLREKLGYLQQKLQGNRGNILSNPMLAQIEDIRLQLIAGLIPFEAILSIGATIHPFYLYQQLCALAGQISGIGYGGVPPRFAPYQHNSLKQSFSQVIDYIEKVIDEIQESYTVIPFILQDRNFTLQLKSDWFGDELILGARASDDMSSEQLSQWVRNAVIVSESFVNRAKENRVLGASRQLINDKPSLNLIPTKGVQLFTVEIDPLYIDRTEILTLFNISDQDDLRPIEIVLYNSNQNMLEK